MSIFDSESTNMNRFYVFRFAILMTLMLTFASANKAHGDLILAGQFLQSGGNSLNIKLGGIDAYLFSLGPYFAATLGGGPLYSNPGTPGNDLITSGASLQLGNLFAAGTDLQSGGNSLNIKLGGIDAYLFSLGPYFAATLGGGPLYSNPGTPGNDLISAGMQLQAVPEPSSVIMLGLLSATVMLRHRGRTKRSTKVAGRPQI
jgi:hypothetical protein